MPAEVIEVLGRDESFVVRLFVAERQADVPGWVLADVAAQWSGYSLDDMLVHPNFPADAAVTLAGSEHGRVRQAAARHPALPPEVIEALLADPERSVRNRAAGNPALPAGRLRELIAVEDEFMVTGAAANSALPVAVMEEILRAAGL